ncbi:MAG: cupin domain-containing protein [Planctomycetota bacterium]|nr:cupin domain-containing protein [Planctomycetota bacterium]
MVERKRSHFVTEGEARVERYPWGPHDWLCRPDLVDCDDLRLVRVEVPRSEGIPFHLHPGMQEVVYILQGKAEQWVGEEVRILKAGEMAHIPPGKVHATFNAGRGVLKLLSVNTTAEAGGPALVDVSGEEPWCSIRSLGTASLPEKLRLIEEAGENPAASGGKIRRTLESGRPAARKASPGRRKDHR